MTEKEKEELFGGGIVFLGQKQPSKQVDISDATNLTSASEEPKEKSDQVKHDEWLRSQTPEQVKQLAKNLGELTRNKLNKNQF
jgi:hypothetical protein